MTSSKTLTFAGAAELMLEEAGEPLHANLIAERALSRGLIATTGKTPAATLNAILAVSIKNHGEESPFVRAKPSTFGLRKWLDEGSLEVERSAPAARVRVPLFPTYAAASAALSAWAGLKPAAVTGMHSAIMAATGTPQENLDWSNPDEWIAGRLSGSARETARITWERTRRKVNPRHTTRRLVLAEPL